MLSFDIYHLHLNRLILWGKKRNENQDSKESDER